MALERTFGIIKPDAVANGHVGEISTLIEQNGFRVLGMRMHRISRNEARRFMRSTPPGRSFRPGCVHE